MEFRIPEPIKAEHDELHAVLARATKEKGKLGTAAKTVAAVLHSHFVSEEEYALPPLALLPLLSTGKIMPEMGQVLTMTERLKTDLTRMLAEHKDIAVAVEALREVALQQKKLEYVEFAEKLLLHAQTEEEVLYPAALLIGEYVKCKLGRQPVLRANER